MPVLMMQRLVFLVSLAFTVTVVGGKSLGLGNTKLYLTVPSTKVIDDILSCSIVRQLHSLVDNNRADG